MNREITYERDVHKSYMKIPAVLESCLDEKLIFHKRYPGILPMEKCYVNGSGQYWYNISGKQALDAYCRVNQINQGFFERLLLRICSQLEVLEWNLIDTRCLVVDPELIFLNNSGEEVSFILYPDEKGDFFDELQRLMEYLLTKLNHGNREEVHQVYRIYEMILTKGYSISDLKKTILEGQEKQYPEEVCMKEDRRETTEEIKERIQEETEKAKMDIFEELEKKIQNLLEKAKVILWRKDNKEEIPMVINPEDEVAEEELVVHPTVCLAAVAEKPRGILLYEGIGDYPDFELQQEANIVGKNPRVKLHIDRDTISQFHAKIDYIDNDYYIEDMNSTNGTFINEEILNYKERKVLSSGDVIRFADVKYRFL